MSNDNQAVHNVLSNYVIENANLKIAIEEYIQLVEEKEKEILELEEQVKEATDKGGV